MNGGRYFEEWVLGERIEHALRRTVTETDNLLISTLTHNSQPLHLDAEYAAGTEFKQIVVNSAFTFALMIGISVGETTQDRLVANLGVEKFITPLPVFVGDTLRIVSEVAAMRESRSRPQAGLISFRHLAFNQRDECVAECLRNALVKRLPA